MVLKMDKLNLQLLSNFVKAVKKVKTARWKKTTTPKNKCDASLQMNCDVDCGILQMNLLSEHESLFRE